MTNKVRMSCNYTANAIIFDKLICSSMLRLRTNLDLCEEGGERSQERLDFIKRSLQQQEEGHRKCCETKLKACPHLSRNEFLEKAFAIISFAIWENDQIFIERNINQFEAECSRLGTLKEV